MKQTLILAECQKNPGGLEGFKMNTLGLSFKEDPSLLLTTMANFDGRGPEQSMFADGWLPPKDAAVMPNTSKHSQDHSGETLIIFPNEKLCDRVHGIQD